MRIGSEQLLILMHYPVPGNGEKGEIMEKYTTLEQALQDTSLVPITDAAATQKELNKVYVRYKTLPLSTS